ncbi:MAG: hypothetical protein JWO13_3614 [Acidobacteriales bacterium]|nr:hypothetical protein [Terriglobales bacterium]
MTSKEIVALLHANYGKRLRVTFDDGTVQSVDIVSVDSEGFVHSGPDGIEPDHWWTRFESVKLVETLD